MFDYYFRFGGAGAPAGDPYSLECDAAARDLALQTFGEMLCYGRELRARSSFVIDVLDSQKLCLFRLEATCRRTGDHD